MQYSVFCVQCKPWQKSEKHVNIGLADYLLWIWTGSDDAGTWDRESISSENGCLFLLFIFYTCSFIQLSQFSVFSPPPRFVHTHYAEHHYSFSVMSYVVTDSKAKEWFSVLSRTEAEFIPGILGTRVFILHTSFSVLQLVTGWLIFYKYKNWGLMPPTLV